MMKHLGILHRLALLATLLVLPSISAWTIHLRPNGDRLQNQKVGENFLVVCSVDDYDGPASDVSVVWMKKNEIIRSGGRVMTIEKLASSQLMIVQARKEDNGDYMCQVQINKGKQEYKVATINFIKPPKFIDPKPEQNPIEGTDAEISCMVDAEPGVEVFWQFQGQTIVEGGSRNYEFKESNQILVIPKFESKRDDGVYTCNAAQFSSFETLHVTVTGFSKPIITVFDVPENNIGYEGSEAQFKCKAVGKPAPTYRWFKGEDELNNDDRYLVDDGLLVIEDVTEEEAGEFRCLATNNVGTDEKKTGFSVFLKPKIGALPNEVKQNGEEVAFSCKYSGEGTIKAKFVFGDQEFEFEDRQHELDDKSAVLDEDDYDDDEKASKSGGEEDEQAADTADTSEQAVSHHESRFKRASDKPNKIEVTQAENALTITIRNLTRADAGNYTCIVENEAGSTSKTASLGITHAPRMINWTDEEIRSYAGHSFTMECEAEAVPEPRWRWQKDGEVIEADGSTVVILSTAHSSSLTITNGESGGNYGKFTCIAENGVGEPVKQEFNVIKIVTPEKPSVPWCRDHIYPNYAVCNVKDESGGYASAEGKPTEITFFYAPQQEVQSNEDFDWDQAIRVTLPFEEEHLRIADLEVSSAYAVRAVARNEAGTSEMSDAGVIETGEAWAPESPNSVQVICESICRVKWEEPNDHGSEITNYVITVKEIDLETSQTFGEQTYIASADDSQLDLTRLKPATTYEVTVQAANEKGHSEPTTEVVTTPDTIGVPSMLEEIPPYTLYVVAAVVLFLLFVIVDLICYTTCRCGLLACCCVHVFGRTHQRLPTDIESSKKGESNKLLDAVAI